MDFVLISIVLFGLGFPNLLEAASLGKEELESEVLGLKSELGDLKSTVQVLEKKVESNIADQFADKVISSIQKNGQKDASKFWMELLNHAKQGNTSTDALLTKIISKSYSKRTDFYPVYEFILKNNITQGFPKLYSMLEQNSHIYNGQEVFVFAQYLKQTCGTGTRLYSNLPPLVREVIERPIILQNRDNRGFVIATQHTPCRNKDECYALPKTEAFIYKKTGSLSEDTIMSNPRSHWSFVPPVTMDMNAGFNGTRMAWGFHLKNVGEQMYLITKLRLLTFFLRENTIFDSYYVKDLQCQYHPILLEGEDTAIGISITEKWVPNTEFIYGGSWGKRGEKITLGRRKARNSQEMEGMVWEVIPVEDEEEQNDVEVSMEESQIKCDF